MKMLKSMITSKKFIMTDGNYRSNLVFNIPDELQQGTVNAHGAKVNEIAVFNDDPEMSSTSFADDVIITCRDENPEIIQEKLKKSYHKRILQSLETQGQRREVGIHSFPSLYAQSEATISPLLEKLQDKNQPRRRRVSQKLRLC